MEIALGCDHAGFKLKEEIKASPGPGDCGFRFRDILRKQR